MTDLAACDGVTRPSMTALLSMLDRSGLVKRRSDPSDRRVAMVALTSHGSNCIRARRRADVEVFAQLISELPANEADALAADVTALTHLQGLEEERRNQSSPAPPFSAGQTHS